MELTLKNRLGLKTHSQLLIVDANATCTRLGELWLKVCPVRQLGS